MPDQIHSYVDEAGDPTLFGSKRGSGVIVCNDGCSKFFIMGELEVADPDSLAEKLTALRHELLANPYFAGVESFKPKRPKTAHLICSFQGRRPLKITERNSMPLLLGTVRMLRWESGVRNEKLRRGSVTDGEGEARRSPLQWKVKGGRGRWDFESWILDVEWREASGGTRGSGRARRITPHRYQKTLRLRAGSNRKFSHRDAEERRGDQPGIRCFTECNICRRRKKYASYRRLFDQRPSKENRRLAEALRKLERLDKEQNP
jgi:hypothetical protein